MMYSPTTTFAFRLKEIGIDIARRTVTKYLEAMNIPPRYNAPADCGRQLDCDRGQRARPVWSPWSCSRQLQRLRYSYHAQ